MITVKLDENNYFTGAYAKVGKVQGGVEVPSLPPDMSKATCFKFETREVQRVVGFDELEVPITEVENVTRWWFDKDKAELVVTEQILDEIRRKRDEVFKLIDKYQLPLLYSELAPEQQEELRIYRRAWLDAPTTREVPSEPSWFVD